MSKEYSFLSDGIYSVEQIERTCLKLADVTREEIDSTISDSLQIIDLEYKQLPVDFLELSGVKLHSIKLTGFDPGNLDMVSVYTEVLKKIAQDGELSKFLELSAYFEEKESTQNRNGCDRVFVRNIDGKYFFCYTPNGSKAMIDDEYRLALFKNIIELIDLPIEVEEYEDYFSLQHSSGAELNTGGPFSLRSPYEFLCELPGNSGKDLILKVKNFLDRFSSGKIFWYSWCLYRSTTDVDKDISSEGRRIYDAMLNSGIVADKYTVDLSFYLTSLDALENSRRWCTEKGDIYSTLCYFESEDGAAGQFSVIGTQEGYKIQLTFDQPTDIQKIEERLQVRFEETE
jgi:hypothetical protein